MKAVAEISVAKVKAYRYSNRRMYLGKWLMVSGHRFTNTGIHSQRLISLLNY